MFRNTGKVAARVDSVNPVEVVITLRGTRRIVGIYGGGIAGTGYGPLLSPGQSQSAGIAAGTARCDGGLGSALPPGHYEAVGEVSGVTGVGDVPVYFTSIEPVQILPNHT